MTIWMIILEATNIVFHMQESVLSPARTDSFR